MSDFICPEGARLIPLGGVHGRGRFTIVDEADYEELSQYNWFLIHGYVTRRSGEAKVRMSRALLSAQGDLVVDHINGDTLDNRRTNLRLVTRRQNSLNQKMRSSNTSGLRGARFHKATGKWQASITNEGKSIYLGLFDTREEAAKAYEAAAEKYHGEYRRRP